MMEENKIIKKYNVNRLKEIFPYKKNVKMNKLLLTTEALYSVSKTVGSNILVNEIKKLYSNLSDLTITDGTANVGSDSINLGLHFGKVNSIEYSKTNYNALEYNVNLYNGNSLTLIPKLKQEIIYLDPPWREKIKWKDLYLTSDDGIDLYIADIYKIFKNHCELFILKIPPEFDTKKFIEDTSINNYKIIDVLRPHHNPHKSKYLYHFIIIKTQKFLQNGGNNLYYLKYIKYKTKYLMLKNKH